MPTNFPNSVDTFPSAATLGAQFLGTSPHSALHGNLGDALSAVEAWLSPAALAPAGAVLFQDGAAFGGSADFTFNKALSSLAVGPGCVASSSGSVAVGLNNAVGNAADQGFAFGDDNSVTSTCGVAGGLHSLAYVEKQFAFSGGGFGGSADGSGQWSVITLNGVSASATPVVLTVGILGVSPTTTAYVRAGCTYAFTARVCGRKSDGSKHYGVTFTGLVHNEAGTTALVGTVLAVVDNGSEGTWSVAVTADDANDCLQVAATGEATVRWVARVDLVEVGS